MKTANVYEIERALQQPITPQQRQTAAANNPIAALMAQRLDGAEGSLRTKLQTPPPPQGTVMNQYYQWPQQQPEMGLAQPGLEEMAQQYAAGGLVAFANGGLASMLPMGYAGEDDVPVFNYDGGEDYDGPRGFASDGYVTRSGADRLHQYPWRVLGEQVTPTVVDDNEEDEDAFWEDMPNVDNLEAQGVRSSREYSASDTAGMSNDQPWPINPFAIQHPGFDKGRSYIEEGIDYLGGKLGAVKERWANRLEPWANKVSEIEARRASEKPKSSADVVAAVTNVLTPDKKVKPDAGAAKQPSAPKAPTVRSIPAPTPVPKEVPKSDERPGVSLLSPAAWAGGPLQSSYNDPSDTIIVDDQGEEGQRVNLDPNNNAGVARIVNSGLSADQQIAAIAKYMQTDTSEAMRIKGEMEKQSARAGNLGIIASLANAVGLGLGTYGPAQNRWGAGLAGLASGLIGAEQANESRQAKLNELALKVKEMEGSGTRKAAEMVLNQRAKAAAEADEFKKQLALKKLEGEYGVRKSQESAGARRYAADVGAEAKRTGGGMNEYQMVQARGEAQKAADVAWERELGSKPRTPETLARWREIYNQKLQELINGFVPAGGSAAPTGRSRGFFDGTQLR
jgi:hypothetical protein